MQDFERGVERLRARYDVRFASSIGARHGFLAGDDARRRDELTRAIDDPELDAILVTRGGYGAMRILDGIDPARVAAHPKLFVGFSDLTAIHALWARARVCSIHGSMVGGLGRLAPSSVERWIAIVEGAPPPAIEGLEAVAGGIAEGRLLGGNLALLAAMVGTALFPPLDGAILFLEDVGEPPYRIDRMLTQLILSRALDGVVGVAVGAFTRCNAGPDGTSGEDVVRERLRTLGVPVVTGIDSGHVDDPVELPFGATTRIDGDRGAVTFLHGALAHT